MKLFNTPRLTPRFGQFENNLPEGAPKTELDALITANQSRIDALGAKGFDFYTQRLGTQVISVTEGGKDMQWYVEIPDSKLESRFRTTLHEVERYAGIPPFKG